jgi:hypothetical protein
MLDWITIFLSGRALSPMPIIGSASPARLGNRSAHCVGTVPEITLWQREMLYEIPKLIAELIFENYFKIYFLAT